MSVERIIEKIKKLIRHEQSARQCSTPEEAAAFASRIQQLLIKHKIDAEQVRGDTDQPEDRVGAEEVRAGSYSVRNGRGYVPREDNVMMRVVAEAHFCEAIAMPGSNAIMLIGAVAASASYRFVFRADA